MTAFVEVQSVTPFRDGGGLARFSSRHGRLANTYLAERLRGATSYDRIAGYFRSSIFELVGEEIGSIAKVRIVAKTLSLAASALVSVLLGDGPR